MKTKLPAAAALCAALSLFLGGHSRSARADLPFKFIGPGDSAVVYLNVNNSVEGVYAGRYRANLDGHDIGIFCTDFNHEIFVNDQYSSDTQYLVTDASTSPAGALTGAYYNGGLASALNPQDYNPLTTGLTYGQRVSQVAWLADSYLGATAGSFSTGSLNDNLAGVNLAIWDIVQDGGNGFGAGQVQLAASSAMYASLATYYEGLAAQSPLNYTSQTADWIQAPRSGATPYIHKQDYITETLPRSGAQLPPAAPEPSPAAAFGFTLLGVAGLMLKTHQRRRQ